MGHTVGEEVGGGGGGGSGLKTSQKSCAQIHRLTVAPPHSSSLYKAPIKESTLRVETAKSTHSLATRIFCEILSYPESQY